MRRAFALPLLTVAACAQDDLRAIVERLDRLEKENRELRAELTALREQVAAANPERIEIHERRIDEQAQTKVETSQKFPLRVTGMALFNLYKLGRHAGTSENPIFATQARGRPNAGATLRQSVIGLEYRGPTTVWGGHVKGTFLMDFYNGPAEEGNNLARIRNASIEIDWASRSLLVGVEKPIFAPREPNSLAQLGISPLTGSGNLWRWQPQVVFEQRVNFTRATQLRARVGVLQSGEDFPGNVMPPGTRIAPRRPGLEGRFEIAHAIDDQRRVEVAPGFHVSMSHLGGLSVPSDLFSLDWFATPVNRVQFTGAFFRGRNVAHFGATRQAFVFHADGRITPVHSTGGWAQLSLIATDRLSFNLMGGQQDDRNSDLNRLGIAKNMTGAANVMYRLAPNVVVSLEALQLRTTYLGLGTRKNNRYDLAVAYMF